MWRAAAAGDEQALCAITDGLPRDINAPFMDKVRHALRDLADGIEALTRLAPGVYRSNHEPPPSADQGEPPAEADAPAQAQPDGPLPADETHTLFKEGNWDFTEPGFVTYKKEFRFPIRGMKMRSLLARLVKSNGRAVHVTYLIEATGTAVEADGFRPQVSRLRQHLRKHLKHKVKGFPPEPIPHERPNGYRLALL
jgi:hypothetical protein